MAEVKWIKITTNMFEDEKIDFIESMPESDAILVRWVKLLTLAGKINDQGKIYLTEEIPYSDDMLAHKFRRSLSVVKMALQTLEKLKMITIQDDGYLNITNWSKHQNIEGMEKIREQNRLRKQRQREREKNALEDSHAMSRDSHAIDIDIEGEEERDIEGEEEIEEEVVTHVTSFLPIIDTWNKLDANIPKVQAINEGTKRHTLTKARANQYSEDTILKAINNIDKSNFLKGYVTDFVITYDWFIKPNNFIKVLENNYQDHHQNSKTNEYHNLLDNWANEGE